MLAALLHEVGHLFAIRISGGSVKRVDIMPLGARIVTSGTLSHKSDIAIYLSGPLVNLAVFALVFAPAYFFRLPYPLYFALANLFLAFVNLLPLAGNDGYCALISFYCNRYGEGSEHVFVKRAEVLSKWAFFILSALAVVFSGFNPGVIGLTAAANIYKKH